MKTILLSSVAALALTGAAPTAAHVTTFSLHQEVSASGPNCNGRTGTPFYADSSGSGNYTGCEPTGNQGEVIAGPTNNYYQIKAQDNLTGWARSSALTAVAATTMDFYVDNTDGLTQYSIAAAGDQATLNWSITNANSCSINNGVGPVSGTNSTSFNLSTPTAYVLTCLDSNSNLMTRTVYVNINSAPTGSWAWSWSLPVTFADPTATQFTGTELRNMATMGGSLYAGVGDAFESQPGATNGAMILRNDTGAQTDWYQDGCKNFAMPPGTGIAACAVAGDAPGNAASFLYASLSTRSNKATGTWTKGATQINLTYRCPSSRYSWVYDSTLGALVGTEASCSGNLLTLRSGALVASSPGGNDSLTLRTSGFSGIDSLYVAPLTNGTVSLNELVAGLWNHDYTGLWAAWKSDGGDAQGDTNWHTQEIATSTYGFESRATFSYTDGTTGQMVFVGGSSPPAGTGGNNNIGIFTGQYDYSNHVVTWNATPDGGNSAPTTNANGLLQGGSEFHCNISGFECRLQGLASCGGHLYATWNAELWERVDGASPSWIQIYSYFTDPKGNPKYGSDGFRGLTCISTNSASFLVASLEDPGDIYEFPLPVGTPTQLVSPTIELHVNNWLSSQTFGGTSYQVTDLALAFNNTMPAYTTPSGGYYGTELLPGSPRRHRPPEDDAVSEALPQRKHPRLPLRRVDRQAL